MSRTMTGPARRPAFTLVELLVVMSIIVLLATLAVLFVPSIQQQEKATRGADQLTQWLLIAKQQAKRDQVPTGVRLLSANSNYVTQLVYVQQPDDFVGGTTDASTTPPRFIHGYCRGATGTQIVFDYVDVTGGAAQASDYLVKPGDYLEVAGGGPVHRITAAIKLPPLPGPPFPPPPPGERPYGQPQSQITIATAAVIPATEVYRIIRQPQPIPGAEPLTLPTDVAIDFTPNPHYSSNPLALNVPGYSASPLTTPLDILFSPSGAVMGVGGSTNRIFLWVRDVTTDDDATDSSTRAWVKNQPVIVAVQATTGLIGAHPVNPKMDVSVSPPVTYYDFANDHRSSGL